MSKFFLSVIIPAYEEQRRIPSTLENILSYLANRKISFEVIVVDDGSKDRTAEIVRLFAARENSTGAIRVISQSQNRGKGFSVRTGMLAAEGSYALLTDADLSSPIQEVLKLEEAIIDDGFDLAFGSRDVQGSRIEVHQSWFREAGGKIFNHLVRLTTGLPYHDTQCGFKLFKMDRCRDLFKRQTIAGYSFDVEILYLANKIGLRVKEVPVVWRHREGGKVFLFRDGTRGIIDLIKIRWNDFRGRYALPIRG